MRRPDSEAERLIALGRRSEQEGRWSEACARYREAVAAAPGSAPAHLNLGIALDALGEAEAAARAFEAALAIDRAEPYANYNLGRLLALRGDAPRAETHLRAALAGKPDFPEAHVALGSVLEARGDAPGALAALEAALALRPAYAGALRNHGLLLARLGRRAEAAEALRRALDAQPAHAETWCDLGRVQFERGAAGEAAHCFEKALALKPGLADAHLGLGNVAAAAGRLAQAEQCFRAALAADPRSAAARLNLGIVLTDQGMRREALEQLSAAVALGPDWPEARWALAMGHVPGVREAGEALGTVREEIARAFADLERWFEARPVLDAHRAVGVAQPFWLAYQEEDNRALLEGYGRLCARLMGEWQALHGPRAAGAPARPGQVRVGVVSRFFRNHSVWHAIMRGWYQRLDPARFALCSFCLDAVEDEETRYARSRSARFEQGHADLERWADAIADARPDVLIYPEVGMDPMTVKLASLRLAPLQAASWGHPETTGLPTIDCYLSADRLEPEAAARHYSERLLRLPNLGCWLESGALDPAPPELARWGVEDGVPLLVSAGSPFKYAPEHDRVFTEIARQLGHCRLLFFDYRIPALSAKLQERLRAAFAREGLAFERFAAFVPWQDRPRFLGLLARADVYLDTLGFSGFNTALQAVRGGSLPVAFEGRFLRGRLASGMLRHLGLDELVATGAGQYVELAVRAARDAEFRERARQRLAERRERLFADPAPMRALEDFLS